MGLTLLVLSLAHERLWERLPASPYFANAWMVLLSLAIIFAGALIAFAMVVAEFALIANTSALTFMVAGTFKEIVTGGCRWVLVGACGWSAGCLWVLDACGWVV
jgi:solute carrier family 35 protein C2